MKTGTCRGRDWASECSRRSILLTLVGLVCLAVADAHEEHEALSSKGVHVESNAVLLESRAWKALSPQLAKVQRRTLRRTVLATGQLTLPLNARAYAVSWLPGRIDKMEVELGQKVQAGQVVAWVRSGEWEKLLGDYAVAQNEAAAARLEWQRVDALHRERLASRQEWLLARARWQEKENALLVSRLQVQALAKGEASSGVLLPVFSPIAGRVSRLFVGVGRQIEPSQPVVEILDSAQLWFRAQLPQFYSPLVQIGQSAEVRLRAFPDAEPLAARVLARSHRIDPQTHTETVWLELCEPSPAHWQPGMQGIAQIEVMRRDNVLAVPSAAVFREGMETYAFVAREPKQCCHEGEQSCETRHHAPELFHAAFERVLFTPGLTTPDWVEVCDGLQEGEDVVTAGRHQLAVLVPPPGGGEFRVSTLAWKQAGLRVQQATFQTIRLTRTLEAQVAILPSLRRQLHAPLAGMVQRWSLSWPGTVQQGQRIVELASWELQQWQLAWLQAELSAQTQESLLTSYRELLSQGVLLPEQTIRQAELSWHSARSLAESWKLRLCQIAGLTEAQLQTLQREHKLINTLVLAAPTDGWVIPNEIAIGQFVSTEPTVAEILPMSAAQVRARVPDTLWNEVRRAQVARFRPAWSGRPVWSARVFLLEDIQTGNEQRYLWAQLEDVPDHVPVNLSGTLTLEVNGSDAAVLVVPTSALWWEGNQPAVFVYHRDTDTFEYRPVKLGQGNDQWTEIQAGLQAGEEVAITAVPELRRHYGRLRSSTGIYGNPGED